MNDFFIRAAEAQSGQSSGGGFQLLLMIAVFFLIMYFLIIRPQNKRNKEQRNMIGNLSVGDEVVTAGGILGKIEEVDDSFIKLRVDKQVSFRIQKQSVSSMMPKGTYKGD